MLPTMRIAVALVAALSLAAHAPDVSERTPTTPAYDPFADDLVPFWRHTPRVDAHSRLSSAHVLWLYETWPANRDRDSWFARIRMAEYCESCWNYLRIAAETDCADPWRRSCLDELRRLLGDDNYEAGRMPPPMPYWPGWGG